MTPALKDAVLDRVRSERFGGISATAIYNELKPPVGKLVCTLKSVVESLDTLIADGVIYEVEPAEYAAVKQVAAVVAKQGQLF